ncbi:hypothetical protein DL766_000465 [Monosporascus sp. MC13-8B]|uniref:Uncharacterized protein n=1 Tax=Monosporascus cannonballus TaxID=155416 RepID=A0ABY0HHX8_9PEZI|nr:hypothetical protein DL762_002428 [Monosporascus cannonballus]RYP39313.1 hypothetical protein DL766_000465 [Monosporascus sp. MC13-8B]
MVGQGPDDEPYDCEWRLRVEGWVCFQPHERNLERYAELAHNTLRGRSLFATSRGYIGIGPDDVALDDMVVVVLYGARTLFILRKSHKPWPLEIGWRLLRSRDHERRGVRYGSRSGPSIRFHPMHLNLKMGRTTHARASDRTGNPKFGSNPAPKSHANASARLPRNGAPPSSHSKVPSSSARRLAVELAA